MPSRKKKNGEFKDVAHPLNNETRRMIEEKVLAEYDSALRERGEPPADRGERASRPAHEMLEEDHRIAAAGAEAGGAPASPVAPAPMVAPEKSMEEVEEIHLSDSFWTV
jgi:hypothetical protein